MSLTLVQMMGVIDIFFIEKNREDVTWYIFLLLLLLKLETRALSKSYFAT
jgi:hypothetical protein